MSAVRIQVPLKDGCHGPECTGGRVAYGDEPSCVLVESLRRPKRRAAGAAVVLVEDVVLQRDARHGVVSGVIHPACQHHIALGPNHRTGDSRCGRGHCRRCGCCLRRSGCRRPRTAHCTRRECERQRPYNARAPTKVTTLRSRPSAASGAPSLVPREEPIGPSVRGERAESGSTPSGQS
jgi:hypothetical protein